VQQGRKGPIVYVSGGADGQVEIRDVNASRWLGNQWLIEEGLRAGEQVVVEGFERSFPDSRSNRFPMRWPRPLPRSN